jgi:5-methylcytosine-specific restriction enzyme B
MTPATSLRYDQIRSVLNAYYPNWGGASDPRFNAQEIEYKRRAIEKASARLSRNALTDLIDRGRYTEVIERLEDVGRERHFLYLATPLTSDLAILYNSSLDKAGFSRQILDLLHGEGPSPARLERFATWADDHRLPNKWTFPTFFLFLTDPEHNLFVKPHAIGRFLHMAGADFELGSRPTGATYERLLQIADEVKADVLDGEGDNVHAQSVMWVAGQLGSRIGAGQVTPERQQTLERLIEEFGRTYLSTEEGASHVARYPEIREEARRNLEQVVAARNAGQDVTDLVLTKLLPHQDTPANRARGAWIHVAPAIAGDVKTKYENAGWVEPENWPHVSTAILNLVERVAGEPDTIEAAAKHLEDSGRGRGFQTGMLTPILSALVPDQFILINNKSRAVVNHFLGLKLGQPITEYPELNTAAHYLINRIREPLLAAAPADVTPQEAFDAFCHWLVAVKGYRFGRTQAWRISVEDPADWEVWVDGGYAGVTEPALGDVSIVRKTQQWKQLREQVLAENPDLKDERLEEVRTLATDAQEGDLVIAAHGQDRILGFGMIIGPYEHHEDHEPQHRVPVDWQDTAARAISEPGWRKRLQSLDPEQVSKLKALPPIRETENQGAFSHRSFELLEGIHQNPTREFYARNQDEFRRHVEEPLKELLTGVAALLPIAMKEVLETEKRLFSRFPKNDFGLGGAWDFYWGAFYPRGGKRIASAQLFIGIDKDRLEYGFSLGDYAEEHYSRFMTNVRRRRDSIVAALTPHIDTTDLVFGVIRQGIKVVDAGQRGLSIQEWLSDLTAGEASVRVVLTPDEVLQQPEAELRDHVLETFKQLFPLVLLASSDNPLEAISDYVGSGEGEDDVQPEYALEQCARDTGFGFDTATLRTWVDATDRKGQAIFYGPPGTGKTFMAEHLARHMVGGGDGFVELVQFHPAYAYEDFIQGIRPITRPDGELEYQMVPGRFLEFCRKAQNRSGTCVLIIDEINRANLSRVFGELMYLLEYRDRTIPLSSGGTFRVPENVRLIGTMNTADRSIALVDHALRRRFAFLALRPEFEILRSYHERTGRSVDTLIEKLTQINKAIADPNYYVGITFFMDQNLEKNLETIWRMEIEPYLEEFFFDDAATVERFRWDRIGEELSV